MTDDLIYIVFVHRAMTDNEVRDAFVDLDAAKRSVEVEAALTGQRGSWFMRKATDASTDVVREVYTDGIDEWEIYPRRLRTKETP